jgi:hypothetical protein
MDKLTDLKLQAFALWMAEKAIHYDYILEKWVGRSGAIVCNTPAELTRLYEKETEEQYVS